MDQTVWTNMIKWDPPTTSCLIPLHKIQYAPFYSRTIISLELRSSQNHRHPPNTLKKSNNPQRATCQIRPLLNKYNKRPHFKAASYGILSSAVEMCLNLCTLTLHFTVRSEFNSSWSKTKVKDTITPYSLRQRKNRVYM